MVQTRDYRIRAGTYAVVDMTTTYKIENFAAVTDQGAVPWLAPDMTRSTRPQRAERITALDGTAVAVGFYRWQWVFSYLTFDMFDYLLTTYLPSGVDSAPVTVKVADEVDDALYLNATLYRPREVSEINSGYQLVRFEFDGGVIIT